MENEYGKRAKEFFLAGYNCNQSVLLAFEEDLKIDRKTLLLLGSSFGGGMGRLREVCGAVSAMFMIAGWKYGYTDPADKEAKAAHYERIQELARRFRGKNRSIICRELLGLPASPDSPVPEARTPQYYEKRPCGDLVADAAEIIAEFMRENA